MMSLAVESVARRGKALPVEAIVHGRVVALNNKLINSIAGIGCISDIVVELYLEGNHISSLRPLGEMKHLQV